MEKEVLLVTLRREGQIADPAASLTEPKWVRVLLIVLCLGFLGLFLLFPLAVVFGTAFDKGIGYYLSAVRDPAALSAIRLTLITALVSVVLNTLFGLSAAWAVTRFRFEGKNLLITLIDIPFTVSPVISGLVFVLLFGLQGLWGPWFIAHHLPVIFTPLGIILATVFVTFPFVSRELIPLMEEQGADEEEAGMVLGASGWQIFRKITVPNIQWGLLYGVILCNARAMGEFGAVSVVSGHIRGLTNTLPLHVEILYNEYDFTAAFAAASLLAFLALVTLVAKTLVEARVDRERQQANLSLTEEGVHEH
jgi:sulfate transport system permease protein